MSIGRPLHTCSAPIHRVTTFSLSHPFPANTRKIALHICSGHRIPFVKPCVIGDVKGSGGQYREWSSKIYTPSMFSLI